MHGPFLPLHTAFGHINDILSPFAYYYGPHPQLQPFSSFLPSSAQPQPHPMFTFPALVLFKFMQFMCNKVVAAYNI